MNNSGNKSPKKDIGQNIFGFKNCAEYERSKANKHIEFIKKISLLIIFSSLIYFLLALNSKSFSFLLKLLYPDFAIFSRIKSIFLF